MTVRIQRKLHQEETVIRNSNNTNALSTIRRNAMRGATLAVCMAIPAATATAKATITNFDPPDYGGYTSPESINNGVITGWYNSTSGVYGGFVRAADGTITEFDPSGSTGTVPLSINRNGTVAGYFTDNSITLAHGFVRATDGTITAFDVSSAEGTYAYSINDKGAIAGKYFDNNGYAHGFVRAANGTITTFSVPTAKGTWAASMNNAGTVTGGWLDTNNAFHSFVRASDGTITSFDVQGAYETDAFSINDSGVIVGRFLNGDGNNNAFIRAADGTITSFNKGTGGIVADAISNNGKVTGSYCCKKTSMWASYVYNSLSERMTTFSDPDAALYAGTEALSISGSETTGIYEDSSGLIHGFVRSK